MGNSPDRAGAIAINHVSCSATESREGRSGRMNRGKHVAVLMGGCDKTVPAQLMGAASAGLPAIQLVGGPMMTGRHQGERLGACTDCRRFWGKYRAEVSTRRCQ